MGKFWSALFLAVPILGVVVTWYFAAEGYWMPRDVSQHGHMIDHLFRFCLILTGVVFVVTEVVLVWFLWRYDGATNRDPVKFTHGSHNLEIIWTILPAATLLFIAIYQMNAWAEVKLNRPDAAGGLEEIEVTARQFEWRFRYAGADGKLGTRDDVHGVNELHIPVDKRILVHLKSQDVLHDFFLPNLRIKQDAVPGMTIPVWFRATDSGRFDLVCAELCGWGHYKMQGRLTIHPSVDDYETWLAKEYELQETRTAPPVANEE